MIVCCTAVAEPGCFHRGGQGGASNQPGVAQKSTLFQYKNVVDYNILDHFSAKNTAEYNYFILNCNLDICKLLCQVIQSEYDTFCIIPHLQVF